MNKQEINILVVDDDESLVSILTAYLSQIGYNNVSTALNGEEALARLDVGKFHLILSDISMPCMNGIQLLEEVKKQNNQVIFIIMSGETTYEKKNEARNKGAYVFLPKPFCLEELGKIIDRAMEVRS
jgi:DNA-binding NtrC family response regulator